MVDSSKRCPRKMPRTAAFIPGPEELRDKLCWVVSRLVFEDIAWDQSVPLTVSTGSTGARLRPLDALKEMHPEELVSPRCVTESLDAERLLHVPVFKPVPWCARSHLTEW